MARVNNTDKFKKEPDEDGSVNSLGAIPSGSLRKKNPVVRGSEDGRLADKVLDSSGSVEIKLVSGIDDKDIPLVKEKLANAVPSSVSVAYDDDTCAFVIQGASDEDVQKIRQTLSSLGVKFQEG